MAIAKMVFQVSSDLRRNHLQRPDNSIYSYGNAVAHAHFSGSEGISTDFRLSVTSNFWLATEERFRRIMISTWS